MQNNPPQQPPLQPAQPPPPRIHWFSFSQVRGHPVVDVSTGEKVGEIGDLLLDAQQRMVEMFTTKVGLLHLRGPEFIPAAHVTIGADAITFQPGRQGQHNQSELKRLPKVSDMIGVHVLTTTGSLLGTVDDVRFDQNTRKLLALEVKPVDASIERHVLGGGTLVVPLESVISLGENYMVDANILS